eukprot:NODE_1147_length_1262_cov_71.376752_g936_i0.p1 GENE.NODE_1147_length_1262_cov_71.376752_g936_i0~~NODE_1147_length_1262_cov_71.376752_g936_i0.p1  ORF type:complete len:373 (-),score=95.74 NODE_1147_length_1262_cov_71.376752_g936_i0:144-1133(-)
MEFGKQWARYYATTIRPVVTDFDDRWNEQIKNPEYASVEVTASWPMEDTPPLPGVMDVPTPPEAEPPTMLPPPMEALHARPSRKKQYELMDPDAKLYVSPPSAERTGKQLGTPQQPFRSVRRALRSCRPGSEIVLMAGRHPPFALTRPPAGLALTGERGAVVASEEAPAAMFVVGAKDLTVKGLSFEGKVGIEAVDCLGMRVQQNVFHVTSAAVRSTAPLASPVHDTNTVFLPSAVDVMLSYPWTFLGYLINLLFVLGCTAYLLVATSDVFDVSGFDLWDDGRRDRWLLSQLVSLGFDWLVLQMLKVVLTPSRRPSAHNKVNPEKVSVW